jgi:segregation and condensation protein B
MNERLAMTLEALLFVAENPLSLDRLAELTGEKSATVSEALKILDGSLSKRGIRLSHHDDGYRLASAPEEAGTVQRLLEDQAKAELSKPALETLSIVAYRGPISRSGIEAIRGVGSEITIRGLLSRGLIAVAGKAKEPGRPPLYAVSPQFLDLFGLGRLGELPPLDEVRDEA